MAVRAQLTCLGQALPAPLCDGQSLWHSKHLATKRWAFHLLGDVGSEESSILKRLQNALSHFFFEFWFKAFMPYCVRLPRRTLFMVR